MPYHPTPFSQFRVCPFSVVLFIGTAAYVTSQRRQKDQKSADKKDPVVAPKSNRPSLPICEVVFVLGGPGAGKGTQCQLLQERIPGWAHLSAGDLLRAERQAGGELGDLINAKIASGALVPSSITVRLLENAMAKACSESNITKFLIDGFPRSFENLEAWQETMSHHTLKFVLNFECPEEVLVGRLLERGQTSGRVDDNIEVIRKRFQTHQKECLPIVEYYEKHGTTIHKIESDRGVEQVYTQVSALF